MSFKEDVADLAKRAISAQAIAQTEEATKSATVTPFLRTLGFDVFDPMRVVLEYISVEDVSNARAVYDHLGASITVTTSNPSRSFG